MTYKEAKTMIEKRIDEVERVSCYGVSSSMQTNGPFTFEEATTSEFFILTGPAGNVSMHKREEVGYEYSTVQPEGMKVTEYITEEGSGVTVWFK